MERIARVFQHILEFRAGELLHAAVGQADISLLAMHVIHETNMGVVGAKPGSSCRRRGVGGATQSLVGCVARPTRPPHVCYSWRVSITEIMITAQNVL